MFQPMMTLDGLNNLRGRARDRETDREKEREKEGERERRGGGGRESERERKRERDEDEVGEIIRKCDTWKTKLLERWKKREQNSFTVDFGDLSILLHCQILIWSVVWGHPRH